MVGFLWEEQSLRKDVFIALPGNSERTPADVQAYASFGDDGTTVTVNRYGNITQISRFLEFGPSGFLCVDPQLWDPYYVQDRMEELVDTLKDREKGLRLELVEWSEFENLPSLGFMYDRWPRYIFKPKGLEESKKHSADRPVSNATADSSTQTSSDLDTTAAPKKDTDKSAAFPLSIQYFCSRGIVIQKYLLNVGEGGINFEKVKWGKLSLEPDVCIRSLDFVKPQGRWSYLEDLKFSIVSDHHLIIQREEDSTTGAALIISAFINDEPAKIDKKNCINLEPTEGQLEISVVYKLVVLQNNMLEALESLEKDQSPKKTQPKQEESDTEMNNHLTGHEENAQSEDEAAPKTAENASNRDVSLSEEEKRTISAKNCMEEMFCAKNPFRKIFFAQDIRLDFAFRRNLEHILSVCSIPIDAEPQQNPSIAITCGDIAGHRVDSRASLSAVQFLCSMLKYLDPSNESSRNDRSKNNKAHLKPGGKSPTGEISKPDAEDGEGNQDSEDPDNKYLKKLHERVCWVLKGHLEWISTKAEPWGDGTFAPHYWAIGRRINNLDYLPSRSLIDTPLQLLKVGHILESDSDERNRGVMNYQEWLDYDEKLKERKRLVDELRPKVHSWIKAMHAANGRGTYTFSRILKSNRSYGLENDDDEKKGSKYCLADHVMIGMALRCVEKFDMSTKDEDQVPQQRAQGETTQSTISKKLWCYYTPDEVRSKILKRFTVVNADSNQRMFATSRRSYKTRFLLHSKDTYLFFAANMKYFNVSKKLSYSNGLVSLSSQPFKDAKSPKLADVWGHADDRWTKLLDAQSNYDELRHSEWEKPLWYAIPFVLEKMGKQVTKNPSEKPVKTPSPTKKLDLVLLAPSWYNGIFPGRLGKQSKPVLHEQEQDRDEYWFSTFELPNILWTFGSGEDTIGSGKPVEKHTTFVNLSHPKDKIDPRIVLDDWLQKPSAILDFMSEPDLVSSQAEGADAEKQVDTILDGLKNELPRSPLGVVIDVPRYSLGYEIARGQITKPASFDLTTPRTVWESKKRIIWLSVPNREVAKKVYEATHGIEKENVLSFLRRNANFDTYFHESATASTNTWETELHLSFFRTSQSEGELLFQNCQLKGKALDHVKNTRLASTTMSLRFSGDFSDRYWTCYFFEDRRHDCSTETLGSRLNPPENFAIRGNLGLEFEYQKCGPDERRRLRANDKRKEEGSKFLRVWQQRRVLELLIYSKMLQELYESTAGILKLIKQLALQLERPRGLGLQDSLFTRAVEEAKQLQWVGVSNDYESLAAQWREYEQILLVVEENLSENVERICQWDRREKDRQNEQPRWTDQDKRNYRTSLSSLTYSCQRQSSEIDRLKSGVVAFRKSLPNRLETIRNDIAFRDSQNINLFTYVTVVFLPLGFAAGILSMNGVPDHQLLMDLVILALGALGITLFALLNAHVMKTMVSRLVHGYWSLIMPLVYLLWQFTKYTFFHIITERAMTLKSEHQKRNGKTPTQQQLSNEQESSTPSSVSAKKNKLRRRLQQKYDEILKFQYREARSELERDCEKKKLAKELDSKNTDEITTVPQESSSQKLDTQNTTFETDLEQGKP